MLHRDTNFCKIVEYKGLWIGAEWFSPNLSFWESYTVLTFNTALQWNGFHLVGDTFGMLDDLHLCFLSSLEAASYSRGSAPIPMVSFPNLRVLHLAIDWNIWSLFPRIMVGNQHFFPPLQELLLHNHSKVVWRLKKRWVILMLGPEGHSPLLRSLWLDICHLLPLI